MVSIPLYLLLAKLVLSLLPIIIAITALYDWLHRKRQSKAWPKTTTILFFSIYLVCEVLGIFCAFLLWIVTAGGRVGWGKNPSDRYIELNATLQRYWSDALFYGAKYVFSMKYQVEGREFAQNGPMLLFIRHASTADTILAAALIANRNHVLLRYVLKRELLWDPCLDIVGRRLPNAFIDRRRSRDASEFDAIQKLAVGLDPNSAVLIYPEGTRFSPEKLASAKQALLKKGLTTLAAIADDYGHVLPPRLGGALSLIEAAPDVDVVFIAHTGFESATSFEQLWRGGLIGQTIHVCCRRVSAKDIPNTDRDQWLYRQWAEIDRWIASHQ